MRYSRSSSLALRWRLSDSGDTPMKAAMSRRLMRCMMLGICCCSCSSRCHGVMVTNDRYFYRWLLARCSVKARTYRCPSTSHSKKSLCCLMLMLYIRQSSSVTTAKGDGSPRRDEI